MTKINSLTIIASRPDDSTTYKLWNPLQNNEVKSWRALLQLNNDVKIRGRFGGLYIKDEMSLEREVDCAKARSATKRSDVTKPHSSTQ